MDEKYPKAVECADDACYARSLSLNIKYVEVNGQTDQRIRDNLKIKIDKSAF
jgi:hypothetical protein